MKRKKPNIILIIMDAVRAQNISCYGYERETTPLLDKNILPQSMFYENAISSSYWTLPSYASIFTGTYLSKNGLEVEGDVLDPNLITMAELLKSKGYLTLGFCRNPYVSKFSGLDRGFDYFYDYESMEHWMHRLYDKIFIPRLKDLRRTTYENEFNPRKKGFRKQLQGLEIYKRFFWFLTKNLDKGAKLTNHLVLKLTKKIRKPFFIFIHYDETHSPYMSPNPFRAKFLTELRIKGKEPWNVNQDHLKYFLGEKKMDRLDFSILNSLYDGAINYLDYRIHEIYSFLEKEKLLSDTMIIITSDHGENLGEHNMMFHWWCLYDTLIKVPLIIKYPNDLDICGEEAKIVQNVDLLPTIMDIIEVKDNKLQDQIQGNSLISHNFKNRSYDYGISELMKPFGPSIKRFRERFKNYDKGLICIRTTRKKYIFASNGGEEFYDLNKDPRECNNIMDSEASSVLAFRKKLKPWLKAFNETYDTIREKVDSVSKGIEIEEDMQKRLSRLGYL